MQNAVRTLEARYAIKFYVKLSKSATEMCEMLQTAYGLICMSLASDFRRQKKFIDGREDVRDDKRCGRETMWAWTSEVVGNIAIFDMKIAMCF